MLNLSEMYDASETERTLGITFLSPQEAMLEVAEQYLEILGKEKALRV